MPQQKQLTLFQAHVLAANKYGKAPAMETLKRAAQDGRLKASKLPIGDGKSLWTVTESALVDYLASWQPGRGAPPGSARRKGTSHSPETRQRIADSVRAARAKAKNESTDLGQ